MRLAAALLVLVLAACGQQAPSAYAPGIELNFMRACEAQSPIQGLCRCTWDKIAAEVPPGDFTALERLPGPEREAHPLKAQIDGYAMECANELATEQAPTP